MVLVRSVSVRHEALFVRAEVEATVAPLSLQSGEAGGSSVGGAGVYAIVLSDGDGRSVGQLPVQFCPVFRE